MAASRDLFAPARTIHHFIPARTTLHARARAEVAREAWSVRLLTNLFASLYRVTCGRLNSGVRRYLPMNRSFSLGIAVASVVVSTMSAQAADLPARSNPPGFYKAPAELPFSWTGFYAGINGGYAWGQSSWSDPAVGADSGNFNTSGGVVGGQLGYNWQTGFVVLGIETDGDWMSVKGSTAGLGASVPPMAVANARPSKAGLAPRAHGSAMRSIAGCPMSPAASPTVTSRRCSRPARPPAPMSAGPPAPGWNTASTAIGAPRSSISTSISARPHSWAPRRARPL